MSEGDSLTKAGKYEALYKKLSEAPRDSSFQESACREINETMGFLWTGFYFVKEDRLILGPYFGPPACEMIRKGKGVCGTSWVENRTIVVPDVEEFPGHIACSSLSRSEIVIPLRNSEGIVTGVLDIDSELPDNFDDVDKDCLEKIALLF
ncbi:MAG: GAF domain-containing protein [Bacteroidales bacterium]|nr:GAF domain-containing protein [Bacteroidales bacterium]